MHINGRLLLVVVLCASWLAMVGLMWSALVTPPPAEALESRRMVQPPTPATTAIEAAIAAAELLGVLILVKPRGRRYATRVALAGVLTLVWFLVSVPLGINTVEQVHRRWLAAVGALLLVAAAIAVTARLVGRGRAA